MTYFEPYCELYCVSGSSELVLRVAVASWQFAVVICARFFVSCRVPMTALWTGDLMAGNWCSWFSYVLPLGQRMREERGECEAILMA